MSDRVFAFIYLLLFLMTLGVFATIGSFARASETQSIIDVIERVAIEEGIDPQLAVAIARTESDLNSKSVGSLGEVGVFQLRPEYHQVKPGNSKANIRTAIKYLASIKDRCEAKYGSAWFICYNLGPYYKKQIRYPKQFRYYVKVMENFRGTYVARDD